MRNDLKMASDTSMSGDNLESVMIAKLSSEGYGVADIASERNLTIREVVAHLERAASLIPLGSTSKTQIMVMIEDARLDRIFKSLLSALDRADATGSIGYDKLIPQLARSMVAVVEARMKLHQLGEPGSGELGMPIQDLPWGKLTRSELEAIRSGAMTISQVFRKHIGNATSDSPPIEVRVG